MSEATGRKSIIGPVLLVAVLALTACSPAPNNIPATVTPAIQSTPCLQALW